MVFLSAEQEIPKWSNEITSDWLHQTSKWIYITIAGAPRFIKCLKMFMSLLVSQRWPVTIIVRLGMSIGIGGTLVHQHTFTLTRQVPGEHTTSAGGAHKGFIHAPHRSTSPSWWVKKKKIQKSIISLIYYQIYCWLPRHCCRMRGTQHWATSTMAMGYYVLFVVRFIQISMWSQFNASVRQRGA